MDGMYVKLFVDALTKYRKLKDDEFGRLVRAALQYKDTGEETELTGREELLWDGLRLDIDRDNQRYASVVTARAEAGRKGAAKRWEDRRNEADGNCHMQNGKSSEDKEEEKEKDKDQEKDQEKDKKSGTSVAPAPVRRKHGAYGWVLLSDDEYIQLTEAHTQSIVDAKVQYVDELAQQTGNKNKWSDWYLLVKKAIRGDWGRDSNPAAAPRVKPVTKNRFQNYAGRSWDFNELERLEQARLAKVLDEL